MTTSNERSSSGAILVRLGISLSALILWASLAHGALAASLVLSPDTGVYTAGGTFTVRVAVNTEGQSVNAAEGEIAFNPNDLSVVSVSKGGSIFTLWPVEPSYSNSGGSVSFGGGAPSGYKGGSGTIVTVTFRAKHAGTTMVDYRTGSVLAADGKGTNILSGMRGASYTVQAVTETPPPEYVPPANTPAAPAITSTTHPKQDEWYRESTAKLSWPLPADVTSVRTLLDDVESSVPTKVYETPIKEIEIEDLPEGVSYFHLQFRNKEGWGRVTHYRLAVDTSKPVSLEVSAAPENDAARPEQKLLLKGRDAGSGILYYLIQLDGGEKKRFESMKAEDRKDSFIKTAEAAEEIVDVYTTPALGTGMHSAVVEAFDHAGNSIIGTYDFMVEAFGAPVFTEYPSEIGSDVIPVIRGTTRPNVSVEITVAKLGADTQKYTTSADDSGTFTFIPEGRFSLGVYELIAVATDETGARSEPSGSIRIAVQESGFLRIGGLIVSVLSVVIPLLALLLLMALGVWYGWHRTRILRKRIRREVTEAEQSLAHEFDEIVASLKENVEDLKSYRKGKLTKQEQAMVDSLTKRLDNAERRVRKEIEDIERLVKR